MNFKIAAAAVLVGAGIGAVKLAYDKGYSKGKNKRIGRRKKRSAPKSSPLEDRTWEDYDDTDLKRHEIIAFVDEMISVTTEYEAPTNALDDEDKLYGEKGLMPERLLLTSYIALIFCLFPPKERCLSTLQTMLYCTNADGNYIDLLECIFAAVECIIKNEEPSDDMDDEVFSLYDEFCECEMDKQQRYFGAYACEQYKAYRAAAAGNELQILKSAVGRVNIFCGCNQKPLYQMIKEI